MGGAGLSHIEADLQHDLLEEGAILAAFDRLGVCSDKANLVLLEDAAVNELHGGIQSGLSTKGWKEGIGLFPLDDLLNDLGGDRLDVGPVSELRIGHDRGRI